MSGVRRLQKELADLQGAGMKSVRNVQAEENNIFVWKGLLVPDNPPFNKAAFRFEITFPARYPFDAPVIHFRTMIYHPNVDDKGEVCIAITLKDNWKAATRIDKVIQALVDLVNQPDTEHPLRAEIAEEYINNRRQFMATAEDLTIKNGEPRPA